MKRIILLCLFCFLFNFVPGYAGYEAGNSAGYLINISSDIVQANHDITVNNSTNTAKEIQDINICITTNTAFIVINASTNTLKICQDITTNNTTNQIKLSQDITTNNTTNQIKLSQDITVNNTTNFTFLEADNLKLAQSTDMAKSRQDFIALISSHFPYLESDNLKISQSSDIAKLRGDLIILFSSHMAIILNELNYKFANQNSTFTLVGSVVVSITSGILTGIELPISVMVSSGECNVNLNNNRVIIDSVTVSNIIECNTKNVNITSGVVSATIVNPVNVNFSSGIVSDSRYANKVSSGNADTITGVTSAIITITDNVYHWSFKCKNEINNNYFRIDNTMIGKQCDLADGDTDNEPVPIPQPITFTLSGLEIGTTVQYSIITVK